MTIEQEVRCLVAALVHEVTVIARQRAMSLLDESMSSPRQIPPATDKRRSGRERSTQPKRRFGAMLTLAEVEVEHIARVMTDTGGNISEAARRLGISRSSLQRRF